ncbi:hypothetical protein QE152_g41262, partial [Popillia japonica]
LEDKTSSLNKISCETIIVENEVPVIQEIDAGANHWSKWSPASLKNPVDGRLKLTDDITMKEITSVTNVSTNVNGVPSISISDSTTASNIEKSSTCIQAYPYLTVLQLQILKNPLHYKKKNHYIAPREN